MRRCGAASGSVTAITIPNAAPSAEDENHLCPSITHSSPSSTAVVRNCVGKKVLHTINGEFSRRWFEISKANGLPAETIEVEPGKAITPELVDAALANGGFDAAAEFANEEALFYFNGNWEWSGLSEKGMKAENLSMIPYYCGVEGEEKAGLNCGTDNY